MMKKHVTNLYVGKLEYENWKSSVGLFSFIYVGIDVQKIEYSNSNIESPVNNNHDKPSGRI